MLGEIIDSDHAYDILEASIKKAKGLPKVLGQLKDLQSQITGSQAAYNLFSAAIEYEDDLPKVLEQLKHLQSQIIDSGHAYKILIRVIEYDNDLPKVLGQLKHLQSQINPEAAYNLLSAAIEYADDLPAVFSALEVLQSQIICSGCAYNLLSAAIEYEDDLPAVFSASEVLLGKITPSYSNVKILRNIITRKLEGQESSDQNQCLDILNSNVGTHVGKGLQQEDTLVRIVTGFTVIGCRYFIVTSPFYVGIMVTNVCGHIIGIATSNDYQHANRSALRCCTFTLLVGGLMYCGVSTAPMAVTLVICELIANHMDSNFNIAKRLSDGIADTLRINDHMQDICSCVSDLLWENENQSSLKTPLSC